MAALLEGGGIMEDQQVHVKGDEGWRLGLIKHGPG
jgi:hypothetical protein